MSPDVNRYAKVRGHIYAKYAETEQLLVNEFIESLRSLDSRRMKEYAVALQPFSKVNSLSHTLTHTHTLSLSLSLSFFLVIVVNLSHIMQGSGQVVTEYIHHNIPVSNKV